MNDEKSELGNFLSRTRTRTGLFKEGQQKKGDIIHGREHDEMMGLFSLQSRCDSCYYSTSFIGLPFVKY